MDKSHFNDYSSIYDSHKVSIQLVPTSSHVFIELYKSFSVHRTYRILATSLRVLFNKKKTSSLHFQKLYRSAVRRVQTSSLLLGRYEHNSRAKFPYRPGDHDNSSRASAFTAVGKITGLGLFAAQPTESGPTICPVSLTSSFARVISSRSRSMRKDVKLQ